MRKIQVNQITGNEKLARDVYNESGLIVIPYGTILKTEYKKKLRDLHISEVFIDDDISEEISEEEFTESKISEMCSEALKNTIERFSYSAKKGMEDLTEVAEDVMTNVVKKKEVLFNVSAVRRKDQNLSEHCLSVSALSVLTALKLGFTDEQVKDIAVGSLLHDMGYLNIKAEYRDVVLDEQEESVAKEIKRHVVYGYMNTEKQDWLSPIAKDIILYHHERINGTGYPFGLRGNKIKPEVRIVAICDAFDNMIYGSLCEKVKVHEALAFISSNAGTLFDEEYAKVFVSSIAAYPAGTLVQLNNGETGIVIRQNNEDTTRPVIRILTKNINDEWVSGNELDLAKELTLFITDTLE